MRTLLLLAVLVVAACGASGPTSSAVPGTSGTPGSPPPSSSPTDGEPGGDPTGEWQLTAGTVEGTPLVIPPDQPVTFVVDGTQVGGRSGCNQYFGEIALVDGRVTMTGLGGTEMGCEEPLMTLESTYMRGLSLVQAATIAGDRLTLVGPGVELGFQRVVPPEPAAMVGTTWVLDGLVMGDAVSSTLGEPATLVLSDDSTLTASTGCRTLTGNYTIDGATVTVRDIAAAGDCGPDLVDQDAHVTGLLQGGFRATVDGQQLQVTGAGGNGLVYRADAG